VDWWRDSNTTNQCIRYKSAVRARPSSAAPIDQKPHSQTHVDSSESVINIIFAAFIYVVLYFTFGYFIAWQSPALRAYYGGGNSNGFLTQLTETWRATPWLFPFQFLRGLLWTLLALPIIRMLRGQRLEKAIVVGLLFAVVTSQLLLPNPLMPYEVRMRHLVETASSNFLFGCIVVWLLNRSHAETDR
jgi:hypothetical protein